MLDLQRQKYASKINPAMSFARVVVMVHLGCGPLAALILAFHERFFEAMIAALWYLLSLGGVAGLKAHLQWCRIGLGLWFILAMLAAFYYLVWVVPSLQPENQPLLPLKLLPIWLSVWSLLYAAVGVLLLISRRIERATMRGIDLWPPAPR